MKSHNIIIDNNDFFYNIIKDGLPDNNTYQLYNNNFREIQIDDLNNKVYFINSSLVFDDYKYMYERGGIHLIRNYLQNFKQSNPIIFFSFEGRKNLTHHLKNSWLKYSPNYFIHFPFDMLNIKNILDKADDPKYYFLKTTEIFQKELQTQLYESLRTIKHDYLNRISRIRPELVTFLDKDDISNKTRFNLSFELDLNFLKNELNILSNKLKNLIKNNPLNSIDILNIKFSVLIEKIEKLPEKLVPLNECYSDENKFINNFKPILSYLDEISELFENLINNLKSERIKNGK
jgi:hypothetical protein